MKIDWTDLVIVLRDSPAEIHSMDRAAFAHVFVAREYDTLLRGLRLGDSVVDCGANVGCFSLAASRRVGPSGRVVAIEPDPENLAVLRKNVEINRCRNVHVVDRALSQAEGMEVGLLGQGMAVRISDAPSSRLATTITLEALARQLSLSRIDAIKIDIEDSERLLFRTESELGLLSGVKCLIVEIHSDESYRHILAVLNAAGFTVSKPLPESTYRLKVISSFFRRPVLLTRLYGRELFGVALRVILPRARLTDVRFTGARATVFFNLEATRST